MDPAAEFYDRAQAQLRAGDVSFDAPPVDGGARWGISVVLRPDPKNAERLAALARQTAAAIGPGHWVHQAHTLHTTLRALEPHSTRDLQGDVRLADYVAAVDQAAAGREPVTLRLRGLAPHSGGVMVLGHDRDSALPQLRRRLVTALDQRDVEHYETTFTRNLWYVSLLQFGAPVADPTALAEWGVPRRDMAIGDVVYDSLEICRWRLADGLVHTESLHEAKLDG